MNLALAVFSTICLAFLIAIFAIVARDRNERERRLRKQQELERRIANALGRGTLQ